MRPPVSAFGPERVAAPGAFGAGDGALRELIARTWGRRRDRYSEERQELLQVGEPGERRRIEMYQIGG